MKVALTIWGNRISPVFDSARKLFIAEVENSRVIKKQYEFIDTEMISDLAGILTSFGIDVLICGAISKRFSNIIETSEIKLIPFITGHVDVILESYIKNENINAEFFMPGCRNKHYRQKKRYSSFQNRTTKEVNMPRSDGTGPQGQGAGTGRGRGPCQGNGQGRGQGKGSGKTPDQGRGQGVGQGRGQGKGRGQGRGQGR